MDGIIDILKNVEGVSTSDGLTYCGSDAAYVKFINSFYNSIEKKAADIEAAYENEDYELYTSKVHSLKSTSRIAGVSGLSEFALKLEEAGKSGDIGFIKEKNGEFLNLFRSYYDKLSVLDTLKKDESESANLISENELKDAYHSLDEYIQMEDYDAVEVILKEVMKYRLPESDRATIKKLDNLLKNMEWEEMANVIGVIKV